MPPAESPRGEEASLVDAVCDSYDRDALEMLLYLRLGKRIDEIVVGASFRITVFRVVMAAKQEGWLDEFIDAILQDRSGNPSLKEWVREYRSNEKDAPSSSGQSAAAPIPLTPAWKDSDKARRVFVVYGRNRKARRAMFDFLRSIGLFPIEWSQAREATVRPMPYVGEILDAGLATAQAVVVLLTPDENVSLRVEYASGADDPELAQAFQARPNVLFEAGLAMGRAPDRTIVVQMGNVRLFTDIAGLHLVQLRDTVADRQELAGRLKSAGCPVDLSGADWLDAGDLSPPG